jgi:dihydrofolate synthase/folylpolyglutamate synthase
MTADELARLREIEREIFGRRPEHSIDPSLDRIADLVRLLGDPQAAYPVVHITGTNGKTSTARMTEALLRARGLRTGLFTSPHLSSVRERICIDGRPASPARFIDAYEEIAPYLELVDSRQQAPLSFFEVLTGMAFSIFADAPVDVAVIEVGMGGTWDNTNVADGAVAVITPISLDHTRYLGATVEEIATDKAGIIKPGAIAVLGQQPPAAAEVLLHRAAQVGATVAREGMEFGVLGRELAVGGQQITLRGLLGIYDGLFLPLFGAHQAANLACAVAAVEAFARAEPVGQPAAAALGLDADPDVADPDAGDLGNEDEDQAAGSRPGVGGEGPTPLDLGLVRGAVAGMTSPGRLEVVRHSPLVIVDSAHNPAGMAASMTAVSEAFSFSDLTAVLAVSADKDIPAILDEMEPVAGHLVATSYSAARSMPAAELADLAQGVFGPDRVTVAERLDDAIETAVTLADEASAISDDGLGGAVVLITGSVVTAGEARLLLVGRRPGSDGAELEGAGPGDAALDEPAAASGGGWSDGGHS